MKAAIYTRVSTDEQAREGYSLEVQEEYLKEFAKRAGWEIYYHESDRIYTDDMTGYSLDRPALKRLLADAKQKKFDIVLVYKTDRFSRKLKDLLNLVEELESYNIGFKSATELFDTTTSSGKLMFQQLGSFAEFERNRIAERVFPGMLKGVGRGNWQGARYSPYGYKYNKEKKLLEIIPEEAEVVRLIYFMYLSGKSTTQIAGYFFKKGCKTRSGGKFHTKLISDILKSKYYLGKMVWNRHHYDKKQPTRRGYKYVRNDFSKIIEVEGKHEAIIKREDFEQVQEKLNANRKGVLHRIGCADYPLSGIVFCGKCGHKYLGAVNISNHSSGFKKRWYRCNARQVHYVKCLNTAVKAEDLEPQVFEILERIISHPTLKSGRMENLTKQQIELTDAHLKERHEALKEHLRNNLEKQTKLNDVYLENLVAIEVYRDKSLLLREEEKQLKNELAKLEMRLIEKERAKEYQQLLKRVIDDFDRTKENIDIIAKKELLRLIFKRVMVDDGKIVNVELYEPFKTFYEETKCGEKAKIPTTNANSYILLPSAVR